MSATVRTFPTFNATFSLVSLASDNNTALAAIAALHAQHIFDLDPVRGGQYFFFTRASPNATAIFSISTFLPNITVAKGTAVLEPFISAARAIPGVSVVGEVYRNENINDVLFQADDAVGLNLALGSRLIPEALYRNSPKAVGKVYKELLDGGALGCV